MWRQLSVHALTYGGALFATSGLALVMVPFYTQRLSPAEMGAWDLILAAATIAHLCATLEIAQGMTRFVPDSQCAVARNGVITTVFWFTALGYAVFLAAALFGRDVLQPVLPRELATTTDYLLAVASIITWGWAYLWGNLFRCIRRPGMFAVFHLSRAVMLHGGAIVAFIWFDGGFRSVLTTMIVSQVVPCFWACLAFRSLLVGGISRPRLRELLTYSWPLVPSSLAVFIRLWIDRLAINQMMTTADVGLYAVAARFASVVLLASGGIHQALMPLVYASYRQPETPRLLARLVEGGVVICLTSVVLLDVFAAEWLLNLTSQAYHGLSSVVVLLAAGACCSALWGFFPGLAIARRTRVAAGIQIVSAFVNVMLNLILIPWFGLVGAAGAVLSGSLVNLGLNLRASQLHYPLPLSLFRLTAGAGVVAVSIVIRHWFPTLDTPAFSWGKALNLAALAIAAIAILRPWPRRAPLDAGPAVDSHLASCQPGPSTPEACTTTYQSAA